MGGTAEAEAAALLRCVQEEGRKAKAVALRGTLDLRDGIRRRRFRVLGNAKARAAVSLSRA